MDEKRELRSFLVARDPSIDRRCRPRPERQVRLFNEIEEGEEENHYAYDSEDESESLTDETASVSTDVTNDNSKTDDTALVYLRLRPVDKPSTTYNICENVLITLPSSEVPSVTSNKNSMEKHYSFSDIFDGNVSQKQVFEKVIGHKIDAEENFTVLTYGTSGSGKTYTLLGDNDNPGIIPRSLENIFNKYNKNIYPHPSIKLEKGRVQILDDNAMAKEVQLRRQLLSATADLRSQHTRLQQIIQSDHNFDSSIAIPDVSVMIWLSFVEIYNESVYDLLTPPAPIAQTSIVVPSRRNLKIVGNDGKVFVKGLTTVYVKSSLEALKLMRYGLQKVNYAATSINENSSRSHCIVFVDVLQYHVSGYITEISYKFCDLAGSERLDKTGNVGSRLKEAQRINTSLLVLGRCIDAANNSRKGSNDIIPYRESRLTMILQAALLGKEKLTMIVNVTPLDSYYEENLNVLGFSSIAKNIIFKRPVIKQNNSRYSFLTDHTKSMIPSSDNGTYFNELLEEVIFLRSEVDRLKEVHTNALEKLERDIRNELVDSFKKTLDENKEHFEKRLQLELDLQKRCHESKISSLKRQYEAEIEDLHDELKGTHNESITSDSMSLVGNESKNQHESDNEQSQLGEVLKENINIDCVSNNVIEVKRIRRS